MKKRLEKLKRRPVVNNGLLLLLSVALFTGLVGCSGSGGGSSSSGPSGDAFFQNFTAMATDSNICLNYSQPSNNVTCTALGGTWNASRDIVTTTTGSYDENTYALSCPSGTATPAAKCRLSGVDFTDTAGLSLSSVDACLSNGGVIKIICTEVTGSQMVGNCTGAQATDASECSSVGGKFYPTLHNATGSITAPEILAGNNYIHIQVDPFVDAVDILSLNPKNPVYLNFTIKLKSSNLTFWQSVQSRSTGSNFDTSGDFQTFTVTSPVATGLTDPDYEVAIDGATLFFK